MRSLKTQALGTFSLNICSRGCPRALTAGTVTSNSDHGVSLRLLPFRQEPPLPPLAPHSLPHPAKLCLLPQFISDLLFETESDGANGGQNFLFGCVSVAVHICVLRPEPSIPLPWLCASEEDTREPLAPTRT